LKLENFLKNELNPIVDWRRTTLVLKEGLSDIAWNYRHFPLQAPPERPLQVCRPIMEEAQGYRQPREAEIQGNCPHAEGMQPFLFMENEWGWGEFRKRWDLGTFKHNLLSNMRIPGHALIGIVSLLQIGYGSNKKTRHMNPAGYKAFLVNNVRDVDLLLMHNRTFAAEYVMEDRERVTTRITNI